MNLLTYLFTCLPTYLLTYLPLGVAVMSDLLTAHVKIYPITCPCPCYPTQLLHINVGVNNGRAWGSESPQNLDWGDANANCPSRFSRNTAQNSPTWHLKRKIHFFSGKGVDPSPDSSSDYLHPSLQPSLLNPPRRPCRITAILTLMRINSVLTQTFGLKLCVVLTELFGDEKQLWCSLN